MREKPLLEPGRVLAACNPRIATITPHAQKKPREHEDRAKHPHPKEYGAGATCSCMAFPPAVPRGLLGQCALKSFQVLERDGTRFEEVGDQEARRAAEEVQKSTHQAAAKLALVNRGRE